MTMLRLKGFEVELYTDTPLAEAIGLARDIASALPGFVCEPDNRNIEYTYIAVRAGIVTNFQ